MKSLTFIYATARRHPRVQWFLESLEAQRADKDYEVIVVDLTLPWRDRSDDCGIRVAQPKPSVWYGNHRVTKDHWWGKASFLNTAFCLCRTEWVCCVDDRSVVMPGAFKAISDAMRGNYAVAGSYEKRTGMQVEGGRITAPGTVIGLDTRFRSKVREPVNTYGDKWFGCINALPLDWVIKLNGYDESTDSLGYEDTLFGHMLCRNNFPTKYDPRLKIIEDRTMPDAMSFVRRTDKGISPNDKSHALERRLGGRLTATHDFNMAHTRSLIQRGEPFPVPTTPTHDWYDNMPIKEFDTL